MMFPRPMNSAETVEYILRIVAQADHEMLLRSGNEAYANALSSHNGTKAELASLQYVLIMLSLHYFDNQYTGGHLSYWCRIALHESSR